MLAYHDRSVSPFQMFLYYPDLLYYLEWNCFLYVGGDEGGLDDELWNSILSVYQMKELDEQSSNDNSINNDNNNNSGNNKKDSDDNKSSSKKNKRDKHDHDHQEEAEEQHSKTKKDKEKKKQEDKKHSHSEEEEEDDQSKYLLIQNILLHLSLFGQQSRLS